MFSSSQKSRRKRGVVLSSFGWHRLIQAQAIAEKKTKGGVPYTLEELNELTGLSPHTLTKVRRRQNPVDKQTLKDYFQAFSLNLTVEDYIKPTSSARAQSTSQAIASEPNSLEKIIPLSSVSDSRPEPLLPEGQVALDSPFYVERSAIESNCYKAILQPGALIRIKAPRKMGKTSLMVRILDHAAQQRCQAVFLSLQMADRSILQDLDKFLQWFSASVGLGLHRPNQLADYWDELFGSKISCKIYFEQYLLANLTQPLVLALDDVDRLFDYPEVADEFFGLLRTWHEQAKNRSIWQQLRLIVAHSTEVYIPLNVNKSPFNVGLPIELHSLTVEQVKFLSIQYGLNLSSEQISQLIEMVCGQPYLIQLGLYSLSKDQLSLAELFQQAHQGIGIYADHLQRLLWTLEQDLKLAAAFNQVLQATEAVELELLPAFQLESLGLAKLQGNRAKPACDLYVHYFRDRLNNY